MCLFLNTWYWDDVIVGLLENWRDFITRFSHKLYRECLLLDKKDLFVCVCFHMPSISVHPIIDILWAKDLLFFWNVFWSSTHQGQFLPKQFSETCIPLGQPEEGKNDSFQKPDPQLCSVFSENSFLLWTRSCALQGTKSGYKRNNLTPRLPVALTWHLDKAEPLESHSAQEMSPLCELHRVTDLILSDSPTGRKMPQLQDNRRLYSRKCLEDSLLLSWINTRNWKPQENVKFRC